MVVAGAAVVGMSPDARHHVDTSREYTCPFSSTPLQRSSMIEAGAWRSEKRERRFLRVRIVEMIVVT